jgi:hypothetical protein
MKTKQEVIQTGWAENWDLLFDSEREHALQNDGWILNTGLKLINKITFDFKDMHIIFASPEQWIRPRALKGIETNNGWIRIESEADLPKDSGEYFAYNGESVIIEDFRRLQQQNKDMWLKLYTHYQPIIKPLPPIY